MASHRKKHHAPSSLSPSPPSHSPSARHGTENAAPSTDELRATLSAVLPLLDAFNHRHRNQHRTSVWWSTFGVFRRSLAKLARALECPIPGSSKRRGVDPVRARVTWLNNHILPRAFVAFTQLMSDNQHAPLGLLLLAILGQVHEACARWPPPDHPSAQQEQVARTPRPGEQPGNTDTLRVDAVDRGTAVARQTFLGVENETRTAAPARRSLKTSKLDAPSSAEGPGTSGKAKVRKKEKKKGDALSSIFGSLA
ncbi:hypothetical protein E4U42_006126 [Claviceps africana]|uniref:RNase MRP protein 1 RNA binding domain-containing protein n=1 Tax=Claviceps africana TaxID=83212 RepID=A0A8K0JE12_9HYPO|nr:hypothetical protein E4U42_006126 [Claviceps africana]